VPEIRLGEGLSALPSLVFGTKVFGWMRGGLSGHDPPDSGGSANHASVGEFVGKPAVTVTSAMAAEDGFNQIADAGIAHLVAVGVEA